jgi:C_GCAxxG_C_C family probable redox protein
LSEKKDSKQEVIAKAYQLGFEYEKEKHYCSQCVLAALQEVFQIRNDKVFQAAFGLAGGVGSSTNGSCGALSGAVMAISYLYGRSRKQFGENISNKKATELAKKVFDRFVTEYGGCLCKEVQKKIFGRSYDFWNEEEDKAFEEAGGHIDKCPTVVANAAAWTAEILWDEMHAKKPKISSD